MHSEDTKSPRLPTCFNGSFNNGRRQQCLLLVSSGAASWPTRQTIRIIQEGTFWDRASHQRENGLAGKFAGGVLPSPPQGLCQFLQAGNYLPATADFLRYGFCIKRDRQAWSRIVGRGALGHPSLTVRIKIVHCINLLCVCSRLNVLAQGETSAVLRTHLNIHTYISSDSSLLPHTGI